MLLEMEGYAVDLAVDGGEGLTKLRNRSYDLVLLDLMLPDRNGMDVLATSARRDEETPIIMLTAYGSVELAVNAIKAGASDYFSKPWDNEKLLIEIDDHDREEPARAREYAFQACSEAALQLSRISWARASACFACSTWYLRSRPAALPSF